MMPAMGLSQALASVVGQCLGAKKIDRAKKSIKATFIAITAFLTPIYIVIFIFGGYFIQFFVNDPDVISKGIRMFKILSVASFSFSIIHIYMGIFNGSGYTKYTMMFNTARLWLFRIPLVYILSGRFLDYSIFAADNFLRTSLEYLALPLKEHPWEALWWSMVISNFITLFIAILLYKRGKWEKGTIHK
jgi:Na+-driven multidrug efflux pump